MDWKTLFLTAEGRIGKKDYWIGVLCLFIAGLVLNQIDFIGAVWSLASLYFAVCVYGKRLHDFGRSAWLLALPVVVMILAVIAATAVGGASILAMASGGSLASGLGALAGAGVASLLVIGGALFALGFLIWMGVQDGDADTNRFGPPREVPLVTAI